MTTLLTGYPTSVANKRLAVADHTGPASYPTGGETLPATDMHMSGFDWVRVAQYTMSGTYQCVPLYPALAHGCTPTVKLAWYVVATGLEVANATNLSAEHIRLEAIGI